MSDPGAEPTRGQRRRKPRSSRARVSGQVRVGMRGAWRSNRLLCYSLVIGVLGGLGAELFIYMLEWGEWLLMGRIAGYVPPRLGQINPAPQFDSWTLWLVPVATTFGGLLCGFLVYSTAPEAEGHGTDAAIAAYHYRGSRVRPRVPLIKAIASAITIGSGGAAGREGPAAQVASGAASVFCDLVRVPVAERRILVLAGMAAGLSAIFRAPLGMAIFATEVLYAGMAFEFEALPFTLIAAVVAYAVNGLFAGWMPLFLVPGDLTFSRPTELVGYAVLGVAAGIVGAIQPPVFYGIRDAFARLKLPPHVKPALGGFLMGLVAVAFPPVLATGFGWVQMALTSGFIGYHLLVLVLAKILAMSLSVASGGSGGVFGPNVYIGAMLGGGVAFTLNQWFPGMDFTHTAFVVVGMGVVFAGTARVPLSTLIMVVEMTRGYGLIVPSMLAASISFIVQRTLGARFKYSRLYESQVEDRLDSPVHHGQILQGILRLLEARKVRELRGIRLPDLVRLIQLSRRADAEVLPGRVFAFTVGAASPLIGRPLEAEGAWATDGLVPVAVLRGQEVVAPPDADSLEVGDCLLAAGAEAAREEFLRAYAPPRTPE